MVPPPLSPRQSARGNRRCIRWREWRWASPYIHPFSSDPAPALWDWKPAHQFLPSGEKARHSACLPLRRWTWRTRWAFVKLIVCSSMLWTNIIIKGAEHNQLSKEKRRGWLCFSPLQYIPIPPGTLRGVCPCLWSRSAVPLLLRHGGDWDRGDRTWIWRMGVIDISSSERMAVRHRDVVPAHMKELGWIPILCLTPSPYPFPLVLRIHMRVRAVPILVLIER